MKKITKIFNTKMIVVIIMILLATTVVVNVQASSLGTELQNFQDKKNELETQVNELEAEYVVLSSLSSKIEKAEDLSLGSPTTTYYLKPQESFASR